MGACWLSTVWWQQLQLDEFWDRRLRASRKGTHWLQVLKTLAAFRLIDPGANTASTASGSTRAPSAICSMPISLWPRRTHCIDAWTTCSSTKTSYSSFFARWGELFDASFDVLLYDLTSTYFESDTPRAGRQAPVRLLPRSSPRLRATGDCADRDAGRLSAELRSAAGNTSDTTTLSDFLESIEERYGQANRIWIMDRGIPDRRDAGADARMAPRIWWARQRGG